MTTRTYPVAGMTCGHCVTAITDEVRKVAGVTGVRVDLGAGTVTVDGDTDTEDAAVRAAVDEAGYAVVSR
jgi:copper chaperone CopZ